MTFLTQGKAVGMAKTWQPWQTNILKGKFRKLTMTRTSDPNRPTRHGVIWKLVLTRIPDPIPWVLTLIDPRPLHCMYCTDAITLYCTVGGGGGWSVQYLCIGPTGRIRAVVYVVHRKHTMAYIVPIACRLSQCTPFNCRKKVKRCNWLMLWWLILGPLQ